MEEEGRRLMAYDHLPPEDARRCRERDAMNAALREEETRRRRAEDRRARGVCSCGHPLADCRPEVCRHEFAREALWGSS
jgi:hypothetical protein